MATIVKHIIILHTFSNLNVLYT